LDSPEFILKGGKEGKSVVPHQTEQSLISKRIFMAEGDEEHMPPKGKLQLTEAETKVLNWWIKEGASFDKLVKDFNQTPEIKAALLTFQGSGNSVDSPKISNIPEKEVEKGSEQSIAVLKRSGILVMPVALNSNYLQLNLRGINPTEEDIKQIIELKKQIVWMNASGVNSAEELISILPQLAELRVLHLNKTNFSDKEMSSLKDLGRLKTLNLSNTFVTEEGLKHLKSLKELRKLFLYSSKVDFGLLKNLNLSNIKIDTGGYSVPTFATDTTEIKPPVI
jgi:hypothetical protein